MADSSAAGAPALSTNIASGKFDDEKAPQHPPTATKEKVEEGEEEDEDIDALIEDLESQDGHAQVSSFPCFCPNCLATPFRSAPAPSRSIGAVGWDSIA